MKPSHMFWENELVESRFRHLGGYLVPEARLEHLEIGNKKFLSEY